MTVISRHRFSTPQEEDTDRPSPPPFPNRVVTAGGEKSGRFRRRGFGRFEVLLTSFFRFEERNPEC